MLAKVSIGEWGRRVGLQWFSLGIGALMALTKSKKHFVGLTWADGDKKGGFAMECDKNDYRGLLAGLEGVTGKKAVNSDAMTVKNESWTELFSPEGRLSEIEASRFHSFATEAARLVRLGSKMAARTAGPSTSLGMTRGVGRGGACTSGRSRLQLSLLTFRKARKGGHSLEHGVGVRGCRRDGLENVPVLHDFPVFNFIICLQPICQVNDFLANRTFSTTDEFKISGSVIPVFQCLQKHPVIFFLNISYVGFSR